MLTAPALTSAIVVTYGARAHHVPSCRSAVYSSLWTLGCLSDLLTLMKVKALQLSVVTSDHDPRSYKQVNLSLSTFSFTCGSHANFPCCSGTYRGTTCQWNQAGCWVYQLICSSPDCCCVAVESLSVLATVRLMWKVSPCQRAAFL